MRRVLKWLAVLMATVLIAAAVWLYAFPPELIRVGTGYSAKIVCSNTFLADRDPQLVLTDDVQAPGHPLLGYIRVSVDRERHSASASLLGLFATQRAIARKGLGCTLLPIGGKADATGPLPSPVPPPVASDELWPQGDRVEPTINADIGKVLDDRALTGPGMRAVVVLRAGRIVGERYAPGFSAGTPLLGWSMTKTVNAAILGTVIKAGKLSVNRKALFDTWKSDDRAEISLADLLAMSSGLEFNEAYGDVSDVTRMLYLAPDMSSLASGKPLSGAIGKAFNYSSGTGVMISRLWQDAVGDAQTAVDWPRKALFQPIGMASAIFETDAVGTFAGSSYLYATARDWARFGLFLMQDGVWDGVDILPPGFARWMREPAPASAGDYGRGQLWLRGPQGKRADGKDADDGASLPADAFWLIGHDGQTTTIIPSRKLVVVRLGLTPSRAGYKPQPMVAALVKAVDGVNE